MNKDATLASIKKTSGEVASGKIFFQDKSEKLGITNFCWSVGFETSKIFLTEAVVANKKREAVRGWIKTKKKRAARAPSQAKETVKSCYRKYLVSLI